MNLISCMYYEFIFLFRLIVLTTQRYVYGFGSLKMCAIDSIYYIYDYLFFRVVETSVNKYISIQNVKKQTFEVAINFGSYDYMGFSNKIEKRNELVELYDKFQIRPDFELTKFHDLMQLLGCTQVFVTES